MGGSQSVQLQKEALPNLVATTSGGHRENWGESNMAEASPRTDTSTDDTEDKNQRVGYTFNFGSSDINYFLFFFLLLEMFD